MLSGQDIFTALCLLLILEGLAYGLMPAKMKEMMRQILLLPDRIIQNVGLGLAVVGIVLLYFIKSF